jgi:hypothetical protein
MLNSVKNSLKAKVEMNKNKIPKTKPLSKKEKDAI